jgi:hypothetical protein
VLHHSGVSLTPYPPSVTGASGITSRTVNFRPEQLQKKWKHAGDFGVTVNYSPANAARYQEALERHIADPNTLVINGTYMGAPVTHFVNPTTGLNVVRDAAGDFQTGWKLNPMQLSYVLTTGSLGGH